jgi:hypothetical protein
VSCGGGSEESITKLPVIEITTDSGAFPNNKIDYMPSTVKLLNEEGDEEYAVDAAAGVRLRGNSTIRFPKKPFKIKFDKKQSLFGLPKNKSWVLLADYNDPTLIKNYTALTLGQEFDNLGWTPHAKHVNLYFNNVYQGVYLLCEQIDENEGRLDLETENDYTDGQSEYPFLVEIDTETGIGTAGVDERDIFGVTNVREWTINGEIKYPEAEDGRTDDATSYITNYVNAVFVALTNGDLDVFEELVDVDSFIDYILLNESLGNYDATIRSIWVHKKNGEKLKFGPVWDFDWAFAFSFYDSNGNKWFTAGETEGLHSDESLYIGCGYFVQNFFKMLGTSGFHRVADRYLELEPKIDKYLSEIVSLKKYLKKSADKNVERWKKKFSSDKYYYSEEYVFSEYFDTEISWMITHKSWLHNLFNGTYDNFMDATATFIFYYEPYAPPIGEDPASNQIE